MKAPKNISSYPKFVVVNQVVNKQSWNKCLPKPWVEGEICRVAPEDQQRASKYCDVPLEVFRKRFVTVLRKGDGGKFDLVYVAEWQQFDELSNKNK